MLIFFADGEIRQSEGFKNVNLGNVVTNKERSETKSNYVSMEDHELLESFKNPSFDVQVKTKQSNSKERKTQKLFKERKNLIRIHFSFPLSCS